MGCMIEFIWSPSRHKYAPKAIRKVVHIMTMIRSLCIESTISMLPNELLFLIFEWL